MALSLVGALIALTLALLGQAPGFLKRAGLSGTRLDQHVRAYTGYALTLVILAFGFFVAGVPIGPSTADPEAEAISEDIGQADQVEGPTLAESGITSQITETPAPTSSTPQTGAFGGPPSTDTDITSTSIQTETAPAETETPAGNLEVSPDVDESASPTPIPPTNTATATSTDTPTLTPTPIVSPTAAIDTAGSTIWLLRSPGGQNVVTVTDQEIVILRPRHANQGGILWREVLTVKGVTGWVQERFLNYGSELSG